MQWDAFVGQKGAKFTVTKALVTRRQAELSSEKVASVPEGSIVHVLEMTRPNPEGIRRALIQDVWGKNSGWVTAVDSDGETNLMPIRDEMPMQEELDRGAWLGDQLEMWHKHQFPTYDQIQGQQETDLRKTNELQQFHHEQRRQATDGAAGKRSTVKAPPRGGVRTAFQAARFAGGGTVVGNGSVGMWAV